MARATKTGFTLIELLVVLFIIMVILAFLLPALQAVREAARRLQCSNNLKQLGLALSEYELNYGVYPASMYMSGSGTTTEWVGGWSINARILPYIEQNVLYSAINFTTHQQAPVNLTVTAQTIGSFVCPSEVSPQPFDATFGTSAVSTLGWCVGDWYVWGGFGNYPNSTAFGPIRSRPIADFRDGTSMTMLASEVRSHQYERTGCGVLSSIANIDPGNPNFPSPTQVTPILGSDAGACPLSQAGHVSWADGSVDQSGITTAWAPNTKVILSEDDGAKLGAPSNVDLDLVGIPEVSGGPTYAAVTSRSYHPGGVLVLFADGSVHFVKETVSLPTWRALATVNAGEIISSEQF